MLNCPDYLRGCKADGRQRDLTPSEQQRITTAASEFPDDAKKCSYCGLVYASSAPMRRLGFLDGIAGLGFTAVAV
jgi:hypothetical protein